jgi:hypothetical protein
MKDDQFWVRYEFMRWWVEDELGRTEPYICHQPRFPTWAVSTHLQMSITPVTYNTKKHRLWELGSGDSWLGRHALVPSRLILALSAAQLNHWAAGTTRHRKTPTLNARTLPVYLKWLTYIPAFLVFGCWFLLFHGNSASATSTISQAFINFREPQDDHLATTNSIEGIDNLNTFLHPSGTTVKPSTRSPKFSNA